jgi:hypothetical protein
MRRSRRGGADGRSLVGVSRRRYAMKVILSSEFSEIYSLA